MARPTLPPLLVPALALLASLAATACDDGPITTPRGPRPTVVDFSVTPDTVDFGDPVTIAWTVEGADEITIAAEDGSVGSRFTDARVESGSFNVVPTQSTTYTLIAVNKPNGELGPSSTTATIVVTVNPDTTPPTITSFVADPDELEAPADSSTTLTWFTTGATAITLSATETASGETTDIDVSALDPASDSVTVNLDATTVYTLTASRGALSTTATAEVRVTQIDPPPRPTIDTFAVTPHIITQGETTTLSWIVRDVDRIELYEGDSPLDIAGLDPFADQLVVAPDTNTTWTLIATNEAGSVEATTTLTVNPADPPTINSFTATPDTLPLGEQTTLAWTTTGATAVALANPEGDAINLDPDAVDGELTLAPDATGDWTLTATGPGGEVTASVTVTVTPPLTAPEIVRFTAAPPTTDRDSPVTLTWEIRGAESIAIRATSALGEPVDLDLMGAAPAGGQLMWQPESTTTFTLTATNTLGDTLAEDTVTVPTAVLELSADRTMVYPRTDVLFSFRVQATASASATITPQGGAPVVQPATFDSDGRGTILLSGVQQPTTLTLTATGPDDATDSETINITIRPPAITTFTATPPQGDAFDQTVLAWTTVGASSITLTALDEAGNLRTLNTTGLSVIGDVTVDSPALTTTYTLSATSPHGQTTAEATFTIPLAILAFEPPVGSVAPGEDATLTWRVQGHEHLTLQIDDGAPVEVTTEADGTGSFTLNDVTEDFSATLTATGYNGALVSETLDVALLAPAITAFTAMPASLNAGSSTTLSWTTENAESLQLTATITGEAPVPIDLTGLNVAQDSITLTPALSTTFTLTATSTVGDDQATATAIVLPTFPGFGSRAFVWNAPAALTFQAFGVSALLYQIDSGAEQPLTFDAMTGDVTLDLGTFTDAIIVTLIGLDPDGRRRTQSALLSVAPPEILTFTADPDVAPLNEPITLAWTIAGAQSITLIGTDAQDETTTIDLTGLDPTADSITLTPALSTTFTLMATNPGGMDSSTVNVTITDQPDPVNIVSFTADTLTVDAGNPLGLSWVTTDATALAVEVYDADDALITTLPIDPAMFDAGSLSTTPGDRYTYRLVAQGAENSADQAELTVRVLGDPTALRLSEVFYDAPSGDDGFEWIELHNPSALPITLSRVSIGHGGASLATQTYALPAFIVEPGACIVVGGPTSDANNGNPPIHVALNFNPDLQNSGAEADAIGLFALPAVNITSTTNPFDAVAFGPAINTATLRRPNGTNYTTATIDAPDVGAGFSIARLGDSWGELTQPTPGRCFGLVAEAGPGLVDPRVFSGRRSAPETATSSIGLATFNLDAATTTVLLNATPLTCVDDPMGLLCDVPTGSGYADLTLRVGNMEVTYPDFFGWEAVDYCNLQFPVDLASNVGQPVSFYGQIYEDNLTNLTNGDPSISAQWGYGDADVDPSLYPDAWLWLDATFNVAAGNNDEFQVQSFPTPGPPGTLAFAFRFRISPSEVWTYCDSDGTVNNNPDLNEYFDAEDTGTWTITNP